MGKFSSQMGKIILIMGRKIMDDVKVSVIMPIYNEEKYLSEAIDSILMQDYTAWELIIVNDASTDRSEEIVKSYKDNRIRYFTYKENRGNPYAQNLGMKEARGEYILAFAGDDVAYPNMLRCQVEYLDAHPECIHVQGTMDLIDENSNILQKQIGSKYKTDLEIRAYELFGNCVTGGASMFRKDVLNKYGLEYDLEAVVSQDYLLWINMLPYGEFVCIDETVFQYRSSYGSNSHRIMDNNREWYDDFMRKIFMHAWMERGYELNKEDIAFIHDYLYQKRLLWKPKDIIQGLKTYKKVKMQSENLELAEKNLIVSFYGKEWNLIYKRYILNNRFTLIYKSIKNKFV